MLGKRKPCFRQVGASSNADSVGTTTKLADMGANLVRRPGRNTFSKMRARERGPLATKLKPGRRAVACSIAHPAPLGNTLACRADDL